MLKVSTWIPYSGLAYSLSFAFPELVSVLADEKVSLIDVGKLFETCKLPLGKNVSNDQSYYMEVE